MEGGKGPTEPLREQFFSETQRVPAVVDKQTAPGQGFGMGFQLDALRWRRLGEINHHIHVDDSSSLPERVLSDIPRQCHLVNFYVGIVTSVISR